MNILRMCLNWRVAAGLGAVGVALVVVAPEVGVAALPLLLVAVCPLSMMFMMRSMGPGQPSLPATPADGGPDRAAALRGELADLRQRQQHLAAELAEAEGAQVPSAALASEAVAEQRAR